MRWTYPGLLVFVLLLPASVGAAPAERPPESQPGAGSILALRTLSPQAARIANMRRGYVGVAVYDLGSDTIYSFQGNRRFPMFSTAKVPIMLATLNRAVREGRRVSAREQALIRSMITVSDNGAASALLRSIGGGAAVQAYLRSIGIVNTYIDDAWGLSTTTAQDMARMLAKLGNCTILVQRLCNYALGVMNGVIPGQDWGVSAGVPAGATVALKNGWFPDDDGWAVNSTGVVLGGKRYTIAVFTNPDPSLGYGIATIEQISRSVYPAIR